MNVPAPLRHLLLGLLLVACSPGGHQDGAAQEQVGQVQAARTSAQAPARDLQSGLGFIAASDLPPEGQRTLALIRAGGPYPYAKDGSVFGNREGALPRRERGYYREYTVPTPGEGDRGARRIVCGGPRRTVDGCYYTADHYRTFRRIRP